MPMNTTILDQRGVDSVVIVNEFLEVPQTSFVSPVSTVRPANTTAYANVDVLGASNATWVFQNIGPQAGGDVMIRGVEFEADIAALPANMTTFTLYLYNAPPPSVLADNAAWDLPAGDRPSFLGSVSLGTLVDLGSTLYVRTDALLIPVRVLPGGTLYGYAVTTIGFTPGAASEVYKITLHATAL